MNTKYEAVIFDLGGTLVKQLPMVDYVEVTRQIADLFNTPRDEFVRLWFEQNTAIGIGEFQSYREYAGHVCSRLGIIPSPEVVEQAAELLFDLTRNGVLEPREEAMEVLSFLKSSGYKIGLISDCGPDLPGIWPEIPFSHLFDAVYFSCSFGMNKGDPRIFQAAIDELGVEPSRCLYIADGMRNELRNASGLGMTAIQIWIPDEIDEDDRRENWNGRKIFSLNEILWIVQAKE